MKTLLLGIGLVLVVAISLGCDENNNVIAQEPGPMEPGPMEPGPSMPEPMTTITGKIIAPGDQCESMLEGFEVGDEISIEMNGGTEIDLPSGKVENMTAGTSVDCAGNEAVIDSPPLAVLICESENSQFSSFTNGDFMSIVVSFAWKDDFLQNITKSAIVVADNIGQIKDEDTKNVPCARVMIETLTASN